MKKIYLMCAAALLAAVGCNKEIEDGAAPGGSVVLTATVESDGTKVGATVNEETSKVAFTWTKGDAIAVQTSSGYETFTLTGDGGAATGEFTGNATPVANAAAIFPAAAAGTTTDVNLPAEYAYVAGQTNALLYATVTSDNKMGFTHLGGLLSFELKGVPAGAKLVLTAEGMKINGAYDITEGQVNAVATETASESTVTVNFAQDATEALVYIPLPVGEYASLKAQVFGADEALISEVASTSTKTIARKTLKAMPYMVVDLKDWFVSPEGAGDKSGSSWDNAMGTAELRALIAQPVDVDGNQIDAESQAQAAKLDGGIVHMAAGDYYLAGEAGKRVKVEFSGYQKQVELTFEGGYPTGLTGTSVEGRDTTSFISAFTGNNEATVLLFGNQTNVIFDGITFKNSALTAADDTDGGAVRASAGSSGNCNLTFESCRFLNNSNTNGRTGAGLFLDKADAVLTNCYFAGNYARNGSCINMDVEEGTCTVTNCLFENNSTYNTSATVQNKGKTAVFTECVFQNNTANIGTGGVYHAGGENSNATFTDCKFIGNTAMRGGAISFEGTTCTFTRCEFTNNKAVEGDRAAGDADSKVRVKAGGAMLLAKASDNCTLNACTFTGNQAVNGRGGAIHKVDQSSTLTVNAGTSFINNSAYFDGGAIALDGKLSINGTSESKVVFSGNKGLSLLTAAANGGAVSVWANTANNESIMSHVLFSGNEAGQESGSTVNYSNGGALYISGNVIVAADNLEFTANRGRNGGGLSYASTSASTFTNCNFHDNICKSGVNKDGSAGNFNGAAAQIGNGTVDFNNCIFSGNIVKGCSAAAHINGANTTVGMTDCVFENNSGGGSQGSLIRTESAGTKLYMNRCMVKGNSGPDRGLVRLANSTMAYMNDVTFKDNFTITGGDTWGVVVHGAACNVCMNNVTSYNNTNKGAAAENKIVAFNSDGGWLVVNSTIIDKTPLALIRANKGKVDNVEIRRKMLLCNNILINTFTPANLFVLENANYYADKGFNVMSCSGAHDKATPVASNLLSQSEANLAGSYSENWTGANPYGVYMWSNALTGFAPATSADVYNAIMAYDEVDSKVAIEKDTIGADFWNWLKEIGEVTESGTTYTFKDARGVTRTGTMWPGAYQAN